MACYVRLTWPHDLPTLQKLYPIPYSFKGFTLKEDAMLQEASIGQPSTPDTCCHWNKLPAEIRVQILKLLMPEHGRRPIPQAAGDLDVSDNIPQFTPSAECYDYVRKLHEADTTHISLFSVSRQMCFEALEIFQKKGPLQIVIEPNKIRFLKQVLDLTDQTPSHLAFPLLSVLGGMHHYDLQFKFTRGGLGVSSGPLTYREARTKFRERARMVADALSTNNEIKSLTIAVPCHCYLCYPGDFGPVMSYEETNDSTLQFLEPFQRLSVEGPIKNIPNQGINTPETRVKCSLSVCQRMSELIDSQMNFQGAGLTERELEWRRIKLLPRSHITDPAENSSINRDLTKLVETLERNAIDEFDALSIYVRRRLMRDAPRTKSSPQREKGSQASSPLPEI
ncbi:MAG: hypothetical protein LQ350_007510 [Teloschistes chrysophthalmus]|nr:MAG: hypothetical protein LQ350_007510 [Niorma chrysophthalma]